VEALRAAAGRAPVGVLNLDPLAAAVKRYAAAAARDKGNGKCLYIYIDRYMSMFI